MDANDLLTVTNAEYVQGYTLRIWFNNGVEKLFDFSGELSKGICRKLKDPDYFKRFPQFGKQFNYYIIKKKLLNKKIQEPQHDANP